MNRKQRQRAADDVLNLLALALRPDAKGENSFGDWFAQLDDWAKVGYPSGAGGGSSGGDTADPTFLAATGKDPMKVARDEVARLFKDLVVKANRLHRYRMFVTNTVAPPSEERLVYCPNPVCQERITGEGSDVPRGPQRECQKCAKHRERYACDWPEKRVVDRRRAS